MKSASGMFLAGAGSRLLPPSIPFRFFGAAVACHLLAWLALLVGAEDVPRFAGGLGWPLAALHLITLGVLAMTAIGASLQLLPVATRRGVGAARWPAALWWLYAVGVAMLALGMGIASPRLLAAGAMATIVALAVYAALLARNLVGARGMPVVVAHVWVALAALIVVIVTALSLAGSYIGAPGLDRTTALVLHIAYATCGFVGMLAFGLSHILVPMFALSAASDERKAFASVALAVTALLLVGALAFGIAPRVTGIGAIGAGAAAVVVHVRLMANALATGMRRRLGRSFVLVRIAWALLGVSLVAGLGVLLDAPLDGSSTLLILLLVGGWLLTFLLGILQRIVPFLAAMHAGQRKLPGKRLPPTPSALTADRPLAIHFRCHLAALALLAVAVIADSAWTVRLAAVVGAAGALAFANFFVVALRRMNVTEAR